VDLHGEQRDQAFDLERFPWPLPDNQFLVVYALQVLEHLEDRVHTLEELYRVCQHGALVYVTVPDGYCPGYVQDPTHKSPWNLGTFLYFCPDQFMESGEMPPYEFDACFRMLHYHQQRDVAQTPWGARLYADSLVVVLQALKEECKQ
jgi:SAM-dependent methyltransferase